MNFTKETILTMFTLILRLILQFQGPVTVMAKDLVRTRHYVQKFIVMRANIQAVSLKIQTLKSNDTMAQAMKGVTKAMASMNKQVKYYFCLECLFTK